MAEIYFEKAKQVSTSLTIQFNGSIKATFNGSNPATVNITPASIGAASSNHTHSYLPLSGGSLTGALTINGKVRLQSDAEGGNIILWSPNNVRWEIDAYNDNLRIFKYDPVKIGVQLTVDGNLGDGNGHWLHKKLDSSYLSISSGSATKAFTDDPEDPSYATWYRRGPFICLSIYIKTSGNYTVGNNGVYFRNIPAPYKDTDFCLVSTNTSNPMFRVRLTRSGTLTRFYGGGISNGQEASGFLFYLTE